MRRGRDDGDGWRHEPPKRGFTRRPGPALAHRRQVARAFVRRGRGAARVGPPFARDGSGRGPGPFRWDDG